MEEIKGIVSDIIPFSLHDGPGIRTTVFLKGCPLRCLWCHNPETQRKKPVNLYSEDKCVHCGACERVCPVGIRTKEGRFVTDNSACTACNACVLACPTGANKINGSDMTPGEVLDVTIKDKVFYEKSNGGVTISGGEPLMQEEFLYQLAKLHSEAGISIVLETCGFGNWAALERILPYVSLFLYDWKMTDPAAHKRLTGVENTLIRQNLERLNQAGSRVILRCPIIPGCNDVEEHFQGIGALTKQLQCIEQVEILPYHALGNSKRKKMGWEQDGFLTPTQDQSDGWRDRVQAYCAVSVK